MPYLVFARKFRPQTFDEVVGQEAATETLKNAISKNRIAQSFLFTGPRGVGKTSTARIFAKALNCEQNQAELRNAKNSSKAKINQGAAQSLLPKEIHETRAEPCNECVSCKEITDGSNLDILEIDGASNRGVDEIRTLRENVKYKPARGRYKVYIIDEVHMLTGEAFNALLKTLEEPPPHVKFIFATTEAHKVPLTILSRCQRFNFRRIPTGEILEKLKAVAKQEKVKVSESTLFLIAKHADGSLRDGESLLDQLTSFGGGTVSEDDVQLLLGLTGDEAYAALLNALLAHDAKSAFEQLGKISEEGKDLNQFVRGLLEWFRDLLILNVTKNSGDLVEADEERMSILEKLSPSFSREELLFSVTLLQQLIRDIRWSDTPKFLVEACLLKIAGRSSLRPLDEILKELKTIEQTPQSLRGVPQGRRSNPESEIASAKPAADKPAMPESLSRNDDREQSKKKDNIEGQILGEMKSMIEHAPVAKGEESAGFSNRGGKRAPYESLALDEISRVWPDLLQRVKSVKMSCGTFLSESEPADVVDGIAVFGFPSELKFHKEVLEQSENKELIRSHLSALLQKNVGVSFVITTAAQTAQKPKIESRNIESNSTTKMNQSAAQVESVPTPNLSESEIIASALDVFDGSRILRRD